MTAMAFKCSFCGTTLSAGTGKMFVKTDGKILYFCSRTCEKHMVKFDRKPRETRWTLSSQIARGKAKAED